MKNSHAFMLGIVLLVPTFLMYALRPVPIVAEDEALTVRGMVTAIAEGPSDDVMLTLDLDGENRQFYINRGLERGLSLSSLRENVLGQAVEIKYPSYWTPLAPMNRTRHVSMLRVSDRTIFSELKGS